MIRFIDPVLNGRVDQAITSNNRAMSDIVRFDWNNNWQFDHEYTDLSRCVDDIDLERSSLVSDLPEAVNTIQGYSSAELTITLGGKRYSDEPEVSKLLSRFYPGGPFFGKDITGTMVDYLKQVEVNSASQAAIQQFRGVIRDVSFDRSDGTVKITCIDIASWINKRATLKHWAVNFIEQRASAAGNTDYQGYAARNINAQWVMGELLAAAGTPIGPAARPDATLFISGNGGTIPRVGSISRMNGYNACNGLSPRQEDLWVDWENGNQLSRANGGPYGIYANTWEETVEDPRQNGWNFFEGHTDRTLDFTPGKNVGFNCWFESWGLAGDGGYPWTWAEINSALGGPTGWNYQFIQQGAHFRVHPQRAGDATTLFVQILRNGQVVVKLMQWPSGVGGQTMQKGWQWLFPRTAQGWQYFDVNLSFGATVSCTLKVNGNTVAPTQQSIASGSFVLNNWRGPNQNSVVYLHYYGGAQHFQVYNGTGAVYDPAYKDPPKWYDGRPRVDMGANLAELSWVPDLTNVGVWNTLGDIANSEFGVLLTDEWGTLLFRQHIYARQYGEAVRSFNVSNIEGLVMNPSLDQYKNRIRMAYTDRSAVFDKVWELEDPRHLPTPDDNVVYNTKEVLADETISCAQDSYTSVTNSTWAYNEQIVSGWWKSGSGYASSRMNNQTLDGHAFGGVQSNVWGYATDDSRNLDLYRQLPVSATSGYTGNWIGSSITGNGAPTSGTTDGSTGDSPQPRFRLFGMKYSEREVQWYTIYSAEEVALKGEHALELSENDWRQTYATIVAIAPRIMDDTITPVPVVEGLAIPCDPRIQIMDCIDLYPEGFFGSGANTVRGQVVGIRRNSASGTDHLDLRLIYTPSAWQLGIVGHTELGSNTILG